MTQLLPSTSPIDDHEVTPGVARFDARADVFDALRSKTARAILSELYEEPTVASELAARIDTSTQNVQYHLDALRDADLVTVIDTWYSSKGVEMDVYAPTSDPLMLIIGDSERTRTRRPALTDTACDLDADT